MALDDFRLILFDADDTLFDFSYSERHSFFSILTNHGIAVTEAHYTYYKEVSLGLWERFERQEISLQELRVDRYKQLVLNYNFEADPQSLSVGYLDILKEQSHLLDGAVDLVKTLASRSQVGIVTNGIAEVQKKRFGKSPLFPYVDFLVISEECGFAKPHPRIFEHALEKANHPHPSSTLMVGDRLETDIVGAQGIGIKTCWFNPRRNKNPTEIKPDFEIQDLTELLQV